MISYLNRLLFHLLEVMSNLIIIDNDCGIDDAWALNFLLNLDKNIKILAITCVKGNTTVDNVYKNNIYFLNTAGRSEVKFCINFLSLKLFTLCYIFPLFSSNFVLDFQIPVYRGAESQLLPEDEFRVIPSHDYFHGKNGFGDVSLPSLTDMPLEKDENAVVILNEITSQYKGIFNFL